MIRASVSAIGLERPRSVWIGLDLSLYRSRSVSLASPWAQDGPTKVMAARLSPPPYTLTLTPTHTYSPPPPPPQYHRSRLPIEMNEGPQRVALLLRHTLQRVAPLRGLACATSARTPNVFFYRGGGHGHAPVRTLRRRLQSTRRCPPCRVLYTHVHAYIHACTHTCN